MREESVVFPARGLRETLLEGRLLDGGGEPFVVSHPHPLHGGTMDHPVVEAVWRAAAGRGLRSLRYNFRGVGRSGGQLTERSPLPLGDLGGAIDFLGGGPLLAAGYSYGARVTLHALHAGEAIRRAALIGLPTRLPANPSAMSHLILGRRIPREMWKRSHDLDLLPGSPKPLRIFAGGEDPLFEKDEVEAQGLEPVLYPSLNHFFSRRLGNQAPEPEDLGVLAAAVLDYLREEGKP
jgi:pimeloyl-ACP methyl ester carboxylesterase